MKIQILAVLLTLVPFVADGASRGGNARVGVNRVAAAGQRMPTMTTKVAGNKSVETPSVSDKAEEVPEEDEYVPDVDEELDDDSDQGSVDSDDDKDDAGQDAEDEVVESKPVRSDECRETYRACMDEFCLLDEAVYRRGGA